MRVDLHVAGQMMKSLGLHHPRLRDPLANLPTGLTLGLAGLVLLLVKVALIGAFLIFVVGVIRRLLVRV